MLFFQRSKAQRHDRRKRPWFEKGGDLILPDAFIYESDDSARDVLLAPEGKSPRPFDEKETRFVQAFEQVIQDPRVAKLLGDDDDQGDWYTQREDDMRIFWRLVKDEYGRLI